MNLIKPGRLFVKAVLLFMVFNVLFVFIEPYTGHFSIYNRLIPGQLRFPYGRGLEHNNLTVENLEVNFAAHRISSGVRAENEYRIFILGDSSVWGDELSPIQAFAEQANDLGVTCNGKQLRFYNLAYPQSSILKDLIILEYSLKYEPDQIILFETIASFIVTEQDPFVDSIQPQTAALLEQNDIDSPIDLHEDETSSFWAETLIGQRHNIKSLIELQLYGVLRSAVGADYAVHDPYRSLSNDLPDGIYFRNFTEPVDLREELSFDFLDVIAQLSGEIPVMVVNEPIFIADGQNSEYRYNAYVPRWAYDQYLIIMADYARKEEWRYVDLWDRLPPEEFTDSPVHLSEAGNRILAEILMPDILNIACPE